ncbi:putative syntaxin-131 [Hordeum vulgare subsp. vulgare]|uniref:Syntaxin N-terminal domain-containing protein n=1 Tax=Hordeum vulgare subsp. vulgare TaxID=112509 RepID=A0A8I7B2M6_HORVV|nr:putative syntaxin-131 [Hordeum vulgare subsp. vulgare]
MSNLPTAMGGERDIELGLPNTNTTAAYTLHHLLQDTRQFATMLDSTAKMLHKLKEANKELKSAAESAAVKQIKGRMEKDMDEVGNMARIMKEKLNRIFQGVLIPVLNNMSTGHAYPGLISLMIMDPATLSKFTAVKIKLKERKKDLENLGKSIQEEYLKVVQSRIFTVTGVRLSDEVLRVIDTNSIVQMFENRVHGIGPEQVGAVGEEIKERRDAAMDLGKKTVELQKNFREMLGLVKAQEKMVKAMHQVQNAVIRARSTAKEQRLRAEMARAQSSAEELRDEVAKNKLLTELVVIGLLLLLCIIVINLA